MSCSFKLAEKADEHQPQMPVVATPDVLLATLGDNQQFKPPPTAKNRMEMVLASEHFIQPEFVEGRAPELKVWTRCAGDQTLTEREAQTVLAFLSDGTLMFKLDISARFAIQSHRLTSIDHSAWFHRRCDVTQWMLYDQYSSSAADGRGLNQGVLYASDGRLVMSATQESMLRRMT